MVQISVKDLGPIAEAEIDLKPLTLFVGPNGTGKSYMALAIYCLARILDDERTWSHRLPPLLRYDFGARSQKLGLKQALDSYEAGLRTAGPVASRTIKVRDLPAIFVNLMEEAGSLQSAQLAESLSREMERCYGTNISALARNSVSQISSILEIEVADPNASFRWRMRGDNANLQSSHWASDLLEQTIDLRRLRLFSRDLFDDDFPIGRLPPSTFPVPTLPDIGQPHYMPASRSGIVLGHKAFFRLMLRLSSRSWLRPIDIPQIPGHVTDLIEALLSMRPSKEPDAALRNAISLLEREATGGTISLDVSSEYPEMSYQTDNGKFALHQVSSMVSELAPIVLFLKYLVQPSNLLIVEEPEAHLDAENQRKFARAIAMMVNAGVKVLITTHSDFFVKQLDNLLLLSKAKKTRRARSVKQRYSANEHLSPEQVGAYYFEPGEEGTVARKLDVTAEEGIPISDYVDAHSELYNEAIALEHAIT